MKTASLKIYGSCMFSKSYYPITMIKEQVSFPKFLVLTFFRVSQFLLRDSDNRLLRVQRATSLCLQPYVPYVSYTHIRTHGYILAQFLIIFVKVLSFFNEVCDPVQLTFSQNFRLLRNNETKNAN